MSGRWFLDTNVLVYAFDVDEPEKRAWARALLGSQDSSRFVISAQVLGEFWVTVTRQLRTPMPPSAARSAVAECARMPVVATDLSLLQAAIDTATSAQLSYWDALIIEGAVVGGCDRVLTEDLDTGATIRGVEIVDPFV